MISCLILPIMEILKTKTIGRVIRMADKKRKEKRRHTLSSMQEVTYSHEFRAADRAAGFANKKRDQ
jgi:hypothetical protein